MPITKLDHVNIRTKDVDRLVEWYGRVLGLKKGPRPGFSFPGAWLYCGDAAIVHVIGDTGAVPYVDNQQLEHFALSATDLDAFLGHLRFHKIAYENRRLPQFEGIQVNIFDCDGNHLHVDFHWSEEADLTDYDGS